MAKPISGFMEFVRTQAVVGLAVGLVIGTAVKGIVDAFVTDFVNPILGVLLGGTDLSKKAVCINHQNGQCVSQLAWGDLTKVVIQFIIIAAIVYFVVHGLRLDRLDRKKENIK